MIMEAFIALVLIHYFEAATMWYLAWLIIVVAELANAY